MQNLDLSQLSKPIANERPAKESLHFLHILKQNKSCESCPQPQTPSARNCALCLKIYAQVHYMGFQFKKKYSVFYRIVNLTFTAPEKEEI